jgi:glutamate synthase domain-containing protein 2/glutamate synthase domain-containing protein 1/glutamate synthase domain-containing protein 3
MSLMNTHVTNAAGFPRPYGVYRPEYEHDACGVGFIANIEGKMDHEMVTQAIRILVNLEHRGAIGGDKATGDGAGLLFQMPDRFFRIVSHDMGLQLPELGEYAIAMVFMPKQTQLLEQCKTVCENVVAQEGAEVLGWRQVPTQNKKLGDLALQTEPLQYQLIIGRGRISPDAFERKLYVMRRIIEKEIDSWAADTSQFYIASMSSRNIVYKGLLIGSQFEEYFPDLASPDFQCAYVLVHQRYSTNTWPTWQLAQPFRFLAHNGEINTLRGNINRMRSREPNLFSDLFGEDVEKITPIIIQGGSDSAVFDNALELLVMGGRSLPHAIMMMIPEAHGPRVRMSEDKRAFYEFHSALMEPWDGPAAVAFTDGRFIGATLDRNGLRPARYTITKDGLIIMASETGVLEIPGERIQRRGRLQPGKMFLVDMHQNRVVPDHEIKAKVARRRPYRRWIKNNRTELRGLFTPSHNPPFEKERLVSLQHAFGYTQEELKMVIGPMASRGQEAIGSMGNDAALAVLSDRPQLLFAYFKQLFAQVTNPPIDPLREELVMSLESFVGHESNILVEDPGQYRGLKLSHPILTPADMARIRDAHHPHVMAKDIDILFSADGKPGNLEKGMHHLFAQAEQALDEGATMLILTDRNLDENHCAIPVMLAASGLHHHLIRVGKRTRAGLIVESGEVREVMHFCLLIAYGVDAICPYVAFHTIRQLAEDRMLEVELTPDEAMDSYITAVKKGLLKTISRMGISTIHSFFGSQIYEAVGLDSELVEKYFTGTASRIKGIGLNEIASETLKRHKRGFPEISKPESLLDPGGEYHIRIDGERHMWSTEAIYKLQMATRNNDYDTFKEYTEIIEKHSSARATLRSLFVFKKRESIPLDQVEPVKAITKRFVTAAMSYGSISKEAHEALAIAMNRIGGRSNSGEGGEDPARYIPLPNGDSKRSRIKQVASGRFGVTTEYLINADELQIKIAQGAKPGEGGQLPGHKVSQEIARVRHTTPGVTLISPPPHHDIYSIEDLAQLIYDLKAANPKAQVSVKLVSEVGVGTIAAGVAKAKADLVLISGHDGGTGASPLTSIKHTGLPWELGVAETQQALIANQLRDKIKIQTDGQLKTGRDLAIAALLGAEEFGFGTSVLITLGCIMMRKCHLNTCPVGVATQDDTLRSRFTGNPDYVERFLNFVAQELREYMAELGFKTVDEMVGRVDVLDTNRAIDHWKAKHLDFSALFESVPGAEHFALRCIKIPEPNHQDALDYQLIEQAQQTFKTRKRIKIKQEIRNVHRTVGATLSGKVVQKFGAKGLPDDTISVDFSGSAGQSFGAFLAPGISFIIRGDCNDYLGKGMSGGKIIVVPPSRASFVPNENVIVGNVVLYGATGGEIYINGLAGERFAVRNSGAKAVVEGVGDHGCEYMTGGTVVVLGPSGQNFAAGMSGGIAYIFDETEMFDTRCNLDMVDLESVWNASDKTELRTMIENHYKYTNSPKAKMILENWDTYLPLFVKVMPIDYRKVLERMKMEEDRDEETVSATEEVFNG